MAPDIKQSIQAGESETVEFKESTGQLHHAIRTLCALANHKAGTVIFGVHDRGKIIGQTVADSTQPEFRENSGGLEVRFLSGKVIAVRQARLNKTQQKIVEYLKRHGEAKTSELVSNIGISRTATHQEQLTGTSRPRPMDWKFRKRSTRTVPIKASAPLT